MAENDELIDLNPTSVEQPQDIGLIDLTPVNQVQTINPVLADKRATKAAYGLKGVNWDVGSTYDKILNGLEQRDRVDAKAALENKQTVERQKLIEELAKQGPVSMDMVKSIMGRGTPVADPTLVYEQSYAKTYLNELDKTSTNNPDTEYSEATKQYPDYVNKAKEAASTLVAKQDYINNWIENTQNAVNQQSWLGWGADLGKTLIPGYSEVKMRGNVEGVPFFSGLKGSNLEQQTRKLLDLPLPKFKTAVDTILNKLQQDNPSLALEFAHALKGQSSSEEALNNLWTVLDASIAVDAGSIGTKIIKNTVANRAVKDAINTMVKESAVDTTEKGIIAEAAGDIKEAAVQKATKNVVEGLQGRTKPTQEALESLTNNFRVDLAEVEAKPGRFGQEMVNRLSEAYNTSQTNLMNIIANVQKVERIPGVLATEKAIRAIAEELKDLYPGLRNAILQVEPPKPNAFGTGYELDMILGHPGAQQFFDRKTVADQFIQTMGLTNAKVESRSAGGYYIRVTKPLNETMDSVRDYLLATKESKGPEGIATWFNSLFGKIRTPEETLALEHRMNRKIATYAPSELLKALREEAKYIQDVARNYIRRDPITGEQIAIYNLPKFFRKSQWKDFDRVLKATQDLKDPVTGETGYFFKSPGELEDFYNRLLGRMPSWEETEAFFAYKRYTEMDRVFRNLRVYTNKVRIGTESHKIYAINKEGQRVFSDSFDGVIRKEFPGGEDSILYLDSNLGKERVFSSSSAINKKLKTELIEDVKEGRLRVIEIYDPQSRPLNGFGTKIGDKRIRYVVGKNIETSPISFDQVPRRGGGHFEYDYNHYIKQANIRKEYINNRFRVWYEGDTTIMPVNIRSMGKDIAEKLDKVRILLRDGDKDGAKKFAQENLPMNWSELHGWFTPTRVNGKLQPPRLNLDEPIQVIGKDQSINSINSDLVNRYGPAFEDGTRRGSLARQYQVQFTGERDAYEMFTFNNEGTRYNPIYKVAPAELVDPISSMNRALNRIVNSTFMDDYKIFAIEHWIQKAAKYLDEDLDRLRYSPFHYFNEPKFRKDTPPEIIRNLETEKSQIQQLLGTKSNYESTLHSLSQHLGDMIYNKTGNATWSQVPQWFLSRVKNPFEFMRSVTFHTSLGMFSIPQLLVQMQTYSAIYSIAGLRPAFMGTNGALLSMYGRLNRNPEILNHLDKIATKLAGNTKYGWKPGEWKEAFLEYEKTGFHTVAGEYASLDTMLSSKIVETEGKAFLNAGAWFFRKGEQSVRDGAWFTAYKEYRNANPTGRITNTERKKILERADLLYVNMSRASSSLLHTGAMSLPTQFLSYQLRQAELFLGKRLTGWERARLLGTNALLYGAPMSVGVSGLPLGDSIRQAAIENGYVVGDNWLSSVIMEGLPAFMLAFITGGGDIKKGNFYNIGPRFGSGGFESLGEALHSDNTFLKIVLGPSFSKLANTWENSDGFLKAMSSAVRGDGKAFPIRGDDLIDLFKEVGSVNKTWQLIAALNTAKWYSKNERYMEDISAGNAVFQFLTGLQSQESMDIHNKTVSRKNMLDFQKDAVNKFVKEFERGLASDEMDKEQARKYFTRAFAYLTLSDYPQEKYSSAISMAVKGKESLVERVNWDYYLGDNVPQSKKDAFMDAFKRSTQRNENRGN